MDIKRVNLFFGHYGSGKTFNAVNFAVYIKNLLKKVTIYDLDIVNPYFRTVDANERLKGEGIELIVSPYAETNVDIPAMNSASYKIVDDKSSYAVVDIGGDDRGALVLGRFYEKIKEENNFDAFWVVNPFRPETRTVYDALRIKEEIEYSGKIPFTAIINNANLGEETTSEDIKLGYDFCKELSNKTNLPIKYTSIHKDNITKELKDYVKEILPIEPVKYKIW